MARWRLGARLRQQNWLAFAIDLVIVVVGVFLGIQASNWNDERRDRHVANAYLDRLESDLRFDARRLGFHETYWRSAAEAGDKALLYAEEGKLDQDQWTTLLDFYDAGQIWEFSLADGTYQEMLNAGRLDLLKDSQLKTALSAYYLGSSAQGRLLFEVLPPYRDDIRATVPYRLQRYLIEHCNGDIGQGILRGRCPPPPDISEVADLNRRIAKNAKLVGELRDWMITLRNSRNLGIIDRQRAARLLVTIDKDRR